MAAWVNLFKERIDIKKMLKSSRDKIRRLNLNVSSQLLSNLLLLEEYRIIINHSKKIKKSVLNNKI